MSIIYEVQWTSIARTPNQRAWALNLAVALLFWSCLHCYSSTFPTFIFSQSLSQRSKLKFGQFWIKSWQAFSSVNGQTCETYSSPQEYMQVLTSARTATLVLPTCSVICWQCRQDATSRIETLTCSSSHTHQMHALKAFHIDAIEQKYASCCSDVWSQPCPPSVHAY